MMKTLFLSLTAAAAILVVVLTSSGAQQTAVAAAVPKTFAARVTNPWFPLRPGTTDFYRGIKEGQPSRDVFTVTSKTKMIEGVRCTVVRDRLYLRGHLEERTEDWYAQDRSGNVWYFGEATAELFQNGAVKTTEGSWQAGVNGAKPGIFMPAHPHPGESGRQEFSRGQAQDHYRVLQLKARVRTPGASSRSGLLTIEWTPLEPGVIDHKLYVKGIGTALEQTVKGGDERNILVAVHNGGR
jgi:hypothetical protein